MMKKPLFFLLLILLLLIAFFLWQYKLSSYFGSKVEVKITSDGFEPNTLNIKKGTNVVFVNMDDKEHWPASDLHPTHGIYSEFDPLEGVAGGSSWSFVFDKVGKWKFHDHLYPELTGIIEVNP